MAFSLLAQRLKGKQSLPAVARETSFPYRRGASKNNKFTKRLMLSKKMLFLQILNKRFEQ
jgi:hypothetical protein